MHDVINYIDINIIKEKIYNINKNYKITLIEGQQKDEILIAQI
jgi:hypothetical protein